MESARGESCPSGHRRGPAAPGEDKIPSPDQKSFQMSTNPTRRRGRKRRSPGSIPLRTVWKPQPHWLIAGWLIFMESARGESCRAGQRGGPAAPGEDEFPCPDQKSFQIFTYNSNPRPKTETPWVDTAPHDVETPTPPADFKLAGAHGASARRELPLGPTSRSRRSRGG